MSELTQKYDKNRVTQIVKEGERELVSADAVIDSWRNAFVFNSNKTKRSCNLSEGRVHRTFDRNSISNYIKYCKIFLF